MIIVATSPHIDDAIIGPGGLLLKLADQGHKVHLIYTSLGVDPSLWSAIRNEGYALAEYMKATPHFLSDEVMQASHNMSLVKDKMELEMVRVYRSIDPDYVIGPHLSDGDPDHTLVAQVTDTAYWMSMARGLHVDTCGSSYPDIKGLLGYEVSAKHGLIVEPQYYEQVSPAIIQRKMEGLAICPAQLSAVAEFDETMKGLALVRGDQSGASKYAEAYTLRRITNFFHLKHE